MKQEEWHLRRFINVCPEIPSGKLYFKDNPDLRIHTSEKVLGIEHTQFINNENQNLKATEEMEKQIMNKAQNIFEESHKIPLYVYAFFRSQIRITKYETNDIARELASLIKTYLPHKGEFKHINCLFGQNKFLDKIDFVDVHWFEKATYPLWSAPMSGFIPEISFQIINERIKQKETRIPDYLLSCDEIWLLLTLDGQTPSSSWDIPKDVIENKYTNDFEHVFLFECFSSNYVELLSN